jgi:hypothetical protein
MLKTYRHEDSYLYQEKISFHVFLIGLTLLFVIAFEGP